MVVHLMQSSKHRTSLQKKTDVIELSNNSFEHKNEAISYFDIFYL